MPKKFGSCNLWHSALKSERRAGEGRLTAARLRRSILRNFKSLALWNVGMHPGASS